MELLSIANDLVKTIKVVSEDLQRVFSNQEIDFNTRWSHFLAFYNLGGYERHSTYSGWDDLFEEEISWYDDFNCDRYQTLDLVAAISSINEDDYLSDSLLKLLGFEDGEVNTLKLEKTKRAMREALMRDCVTHMYNDW